MKEKWAEKYLNEQNDRCWFCGKSGCDEFDMEWDTYLHRHCLENELKNNPENGEARLMEYLIKD